MFALNYESERTGGWADYHSPELSGKDTNLLSSYLQEVCRTQLLTMEQEIALADRIAQGDTSARDYLIKANLRLVISIAKKYVGCGLPLLDLIQEGNIGLLEAADKFDPKKGCRFATYATWWVRQAVLRGLANYGRTIRLPVHIVNLHRRYCKLENQYWKESGEMPPLREISRELFPVSADKIRNKLSKKMKRILSLDDPLVLEKLEEEEAEAENRLLNIMKIAHDPLSFDMPVNDSGKVLWETISDDNGFDNKNELEDIKDSFDCLDEKEKAILVLRYGLHGGAPQTLHQISEKMNLSKERIRQKEAEAIRKIKNSGAFVSK